MTRDEFVALDAATPPLLCLSGHMGLCPHHTDTEVLVDVYENNRLLETRPIRFEMIRKIGRGGLFEIDQSYIDHMAWAKARAIENLEGKIPLCGLAIASLQSDLRKNKLTCLLLTPDFNIKTTHLAIKGDIVETRAWIEALQ